MAEPDVACAYLSILDTETEVLKKFKVSLGSVARPCLKTVENLKTIEGGGEGTWKKKIWAVITVNVYVCYKMWSNAGV